MRDYLNLVRYHENEGGFLGRLHKELEGLSPEARELVSAGFKKVAREMEVEWDVESASEKSARLKKEKEEAKKEEQERKKKEREEKKRNSRKE